jgi:uncharacterized protein YegP (UPF0339 family)
MSKAQKIKPGVTIYKDKRGEWRWRAVASNGRILAVSSESYKNRPDCVAGASAAAGILTAWRRA